MNFWIIELSPNFQWFIFAQNVKKKWDSILEKFLLFDVVKYISEVLQ